MPRWINDTGASIDSFVSRSARRVNARDLPDELESYLRRASFGITHMASPRRVGASFRELPLSNDTRASAVTFLLFSARTYLQVQFAQQQQLPIVKPPLSRVLTVNLAATRSARARKRIERMESQVKYENKMRGILETR